MSFSRKLLNVALAAVLWTGLAITEKSSEAQDCGCNQSTVQASSGCGTSTGHCGHHGGRGFGLIAHFQNRMGCDPSLIDGLWDNYPNERYACPNEPFGWMSRTAEHGIFGGHLRGHFGGGCLTRGCGATSCDVTSEQARRFALLRPRVHSSCDTPVQTPAPCDSHCRLKSGMLMNFGNLCKGRGFRSCCGKKHVGSGCFKSCGHLFGTCSSSRFRRLSLLHGGCSTGCDSALPAPPVNGCGCN